MDQQLILNEAKTHGTRWNSRGMALLALAGAVLLWGTSYAAAKTALQQVSPATLIGLRMLLASLVLLPFWSRLPRPRYQAGDGRWLLVLGLLQPCLYFLCEVQALRHTSSAQAGTIAALVPLFVAVMARIWLGERLRTPALLGLLASLAGVILLSLAAVGSVAAPDPLLGNSLQLMAMLCAASYMVLLKRLSDRYDTWWLTGVQNLLGVLFYLPAVWLARDSLLTVDLQGWLATGYLGGIVTLGGFGLYNMALRVLPASEAALSINLVPLLAILVGWLLLGEAMTPLQSLAALLILGGVVISQIKIRAND